MINFSMVSGIFEVISLIVLVVLAFGFLIVFHEMGHFLAAKWCGVAAPEFAFGMGKELFGVTVGETRYKICLLPIGGYVRLVGEEADETQEKVWPPERNFRNKRSWQKMLIIFAGPLMNLILAWIFYVVLFMAWGIEKPLPGNADPRSDVVIYQVLNDSPAQRSGLMEGDVVKAINGEAMKSVAQFRDTTAKNGGNVLELSVLREARKETLWTRFKTRLKQGGAPDAANGAPTGNLILKVTPENEKGESQAKIGVMPGPGKEFIQPRVVSEVKSPNLFEGDRLENGDVILSVDDKAFDEKTQLRKGSLIAVLRNGKERTLTPAGGFAPAAFSTLVSLESPVYRPGPLKACSMSLVKMRNVLYETWYFLKMMFQKKISAGGVSGPVGIIRFTYQSAKAGLNSLIAFTAFISIQLAIINLLPIPALDGSRLAFLFWGAISRKPLDPAREGMVHYVGFFFLMALMLFLVVKDIVNPSLLNI